MSRLLCVVAVAGCAGGGGGWTVERAEQITTIRGMKVHVLLCRELEPERRYACEAGARLPGEAYDTVGIHYEIRVLSDDHYVLRNVRFIGGPGIP